MKSHLGKWYNNLANSLEDIYHLQEVTEQERINAAFIELNKKVIF